MASVFSITETRPQINMGLSKESSRDEVTKVIKNESECWSIGY